jgi:hypothetical protein
MGLCLIQVFLRIEGIKNTQEMWMERKNTKRILTLAFFVFILFLIFYNLTDFPTPWYDEGSHLHVPKTLIQYGQYADRSSEGFRYYGPTVGVGPTVMLPIAAVFKLFGIGLLQARLVMVLYLLATIVVFFQYAKMMGGRATAWVATGLLVTSQGIAFLEYGRQVLGEVPGMLFILLAFWIWFARLEKPGFWRLALVGLLAGLAMVTKNQYLIVLMPTFVAGWFLNLIYYRSAKWWYFVIPAATAAGVYGIWQGMLVVGLGPSNAAENFANLRIATSGAALVFSPVLMKRSIGELFSLKVYLGWLVPILLYGLSLCLPRNKEGMKWGILMSFIGVNLTWYVVASVSWLRYAFPALVMVCLFAGRFFDDVTDHFNVEWRVFLDAMRGKPVELKTQAFRAMATIWLAVMLLIPLAQNLKNILLPPFNSPKAMASYMDAKIPKDALIETWEPEIGFLTDHNYHYPPQILLDTAVGYIWRGGPPPSQAYNFIDQGFPEYVLVGKFSTWVQLYPVEILQKYYEPIQQIGTYTLYQLK